MKINIYKQKIKEVLNTLQVKLNNFSIPKRGIKLIEWYKEAIIKNDKIYYNKNIENKYRFNRGEVYWINFGENIGSEFNGDHFGVVLYESYYTIIVAPLSSKKKNEGKWKQKENLMIDIGKIPNISNNKESYVLLHQIKTVSKKRASLSTKNRKRSKIKLTNKQLDKIDNAIKEHLTK